MTMIRKWADVSGCWLLDWARKSGLYFVIGMLVCWLTLNAMAGPGVVVIEQVEAEGPQFSDPTTLDIVSTIHRNRACPSQTQRWIWRKLNDKGSVWHEGDGEWSEQAIPLVSTVMPFLSESRKLILTLPAPNIPDPQNGGWMFRSVTTEHCSFMPTQIGELFGARVFRSRDIPVNFVGAAHPEPPK